MLENWRGPIGHKFQSTTRPTDHSMQSRERIYNQVLIERVDPGSRPGEIYLLRGGVYADWFAFGVGGSEAEFLRDSESENFSSINP